MDLSDRDLASADARPIDVEPQCSGFISPCSPFDRLVDACVGAGLGEAVLPVIPPDALVSENLAANRGKIPGKLNADGSWYGFKEWTKHVTTLEDIVLWRTWPNAGLCIRTALLPALDIDVDDTALAKQIVNLVRKRLGPGALVRTRERSPRVAILFRTDALVRKIRIEFTFLGASRQAVELLGSGQQLVIAGRHPSGAMYGLEGLGQCDRKFDSIPILKTQEVGDLVDAVHAIIRDAGGLPVQNARSSKARQAGERLAPEPALMRAVVARREAWVPLLFNWGPGPADRPWRITGGELCRDGTLEEDLCIYPDGIYDFGTERSHNPISLICEFGDVDEDGEIGFGGAPEYGSKGDYLYAVMGESNPSVRRPTETEAIAWLLVCLDGQAISKGASRETMLSCLAAAVGLDWQTIRSEHARTLSLVPIDDAGDPIQEMSPEMWTKRDIVANASRITAKRALDPAGFEQWRYAWDNSGAATDDAELSSLLSAEEARARAYVPAVEEPQPSALIGLPGAISRTKGFELITGIIDASGIPTRKHIIYPRCPCGDVLLTVAEPGASKSTLALFDALTIASGEERILRGENDVSPERLHRPGPAIVYDAEDPLDEMRRRLVAAQRAYGLTGMRHAIALWSGVGDDFLRIARRCPDTKALVPVDGVALLLKRIRETGARYVALGPFAGLAEGLNENDSADCNTVMQILTRIAAETGVCINVIHHTSKSGGTEAGRMNAARGSSAIAAKARAMVTLNNLTVEEAKLYGVPARDHFAMTYAKLSHGRKPGGPIIFRRESVSVGNGSGLELDSRDVFDVTPHDRLQAEGDEAPVLRPVRVGSMPLREAAREQRQNVANDGAASAVLDVLGGIGQRPLADIRPELTARLQEQKLIRGSARNTVQTFLSTHLGGSGQLVMHGGQKVRVRMEKAGLKLNDPWCAVVEPAPDMTGGPS